MCITLCQYFKFSSQKKNPLGVSGAKGFFGSLKGGDLRNILEALREKALFKRRFRAIQESPGPYMKSLKTLKHP